jgi:hypothetical protein
MIVGATITLSRNGVVYGSGVTNGAGVLIIDELPVYLSDGIALTLYEYTIEADNFNEYQGSFHFELIALDGSEDNTTLIIQPEMESPLFGVSGVISVENGFGTEPIAGVTVQIGTKTTTTAADGSYSIPESFYNLSEHVVTISGDLVNTAIGSVEIDGETVFNATTTAKTVTPFRSTDSFGFDATLGGTPMSLGYQIVFLRPGRITSIGSKSVTQWDASNPSGDPMPGGFVYQFRIYKQNIHAPLYRSAEVPIATLDTYAYVDLPTPIEVGVNDQLILAVYVRGFDEKQVYCKSSLRSPRTLRVGQTDVCQLIKYLESWGDTEPAQAPISGRNALIDFKFKVGY